MELGEDVRRAREVSPMDDPPPGYVTRVTPERVGGVGPWRT